MSLNNGELTYIRQWRIIIDKVSMGLVKDQANIKKHGISFEEASELFKLPYNLILELYDFEQQRYEQAIAGETYD